MVSTTLEEIPLDRQSLASNAMPLKPTELGAGKEPGPAIRGRLNRAETFLELLPCLECLWTRCETFSPRTQMQNSTSFPPTVLILGFGEITDINYLYSVITLVGFMVIILSNCTVITTVMLSKSLHEPMFIFISSLCANGLYGSISFFPNLFINLIYKTKIISYIGCFLQVFCIYTYASCEITMLAVMAYDRYVCICNPLRYVSIMTLITAFKLVFAAWTFSFILITILVTLSARLPLCDNVILKIYCDNWSVVRLSCIDTTVNNIFGVFVTVATMGVMPFLIVLSYIEIAKVCAKSKDVREKAMQTCAPQLISIIIFVTGCVFEILLYRFVPTRVPYGLRVFMSVEVIVVPPLVNPLLYGLKMKAIKVRIRQFYLDKLNLRKTNK
ncbi:olfactory receptor 52E4-like [Mixophyes fleayi]|uniref:olfactory receptor 52E4-like n=1 Tax=Mixophyes fleayi TaxID=3061075 RepID=UPI003F4DD72E